MEWLKWSAKVCVVWSAGFMLLNIILVLLKHANGGLIFGGVYV
jgi:hypothetical protein